MKKKAIWIILVLLVLGVVVFFVLRNTKEKDESKDEDKETVVEQEEEKDTKYEYTGDTDFSSYSIKTQTVGEDSESKYSILGVKDSEEDGYHKFVFSLKESEKENEDLDDSGPFVTATYLSNLGVIRIDFQNISIDSTDIGYQQDRNIDKDGVLRIYHNVSGEEDQELYDIGVRTDAPFKLTSDFIEKDNTWEVILQVKYPGGLDIEVDLGSEEFSREDQGIKGAGVAEDATISAYSYGRPSGLLKLVWTVTAQGDNPIPTVSSLINGDGDLVVVFDGIVLDRVASTLSESVTLSSGISLRAERQENTSIYVFSNISSSAEYRLSASLGPNQVVLEIK